MVAGFVKSVGVLATLREISRGSIAMKLVSVVVDLDFGMAVVVDLDFGMAVVVMMSGRGMGTVVSLVVDTGEPLVIAVEIGRMSGVSVYPSSSTPMDAVSEVDTMNAMVLSDAGEIVRD